MHGRWQETALWTLVTAALVAWLTRKGITTYFFAEAFVYLGEYRAAGNSFLGALVRPHAAIFYRPSLWAVNLAWNLYAPPDALVYHLRNVAFVVLNALLLHRLLLRFLDDRFGRGVAMTFYAISKVHMTTIGYVATFSTLLLLCATLAMFLAFCRWLEGRRAADFALTLLFAAFLISSKDYGAVAVLLLPVLAWARGENAMRAMRPFAIPLAVLIGAYAGLRAWVSPARATGTYAPRVEAFVIAKKSVQAATTLANLSLFEKGGTMGARGVTQWIWADGSDAGRIAEGVVLLAFLGYALVLIRRVRMPLLCFCLAWGALLFAPTLLGRNEQVYYHNDLVAAFAVLLGAASVRASRPLVIGVLVLLALNAEVSQRRPERYAWYVMSEEVRPIATLPLPADVRRVVFVAKDREQWDFVLTASGHTPFVQTVLGRPELDVRVSDGADVRPDEVAIDVRTMSRVSPPRPARVPARSGRDASAAPRLPAAAS